MQADRLTQGIGSRTDIQLAKPLSTLFKHLHPSPAILSNRLRMGVCTAMRYPSFSCVDLELQGRQFAKQLHHSFLGLFVSQKQRSHSRTVSAVRGGTLPLTVRLHHLTAYYWWQFFLTVLTSSRFSSCTTFFPSPKTCSILHKAGFLSLTTWLGTSFPTTLFCPLSIWYLVLH
jgi:hypothetical protein